MFISLNGSHKLGYHSWRRRGSPTAPRPEVNPPSRFPSTRQRLADCPRNPDTAVTMTPSSNGRSPASLFQRRRCLWKMLDHFPACCGTILACFGTIGHVFVLGEFGTGGAALIARLGTGLADHGGEWTVARSEFGSRRADLRAVIAQNQGLAVVLLTRAQQVQATMITGCARIRAIRTSLRAS